MAKIAEREVIFKFVGDNKQLDKTTKQVEKRIGGLSSVFNQAKAQFAGLFAFDVVSRFAGGIQQLAGNAVNLAISAEQTQVAFETFLGSASKARDVIAELNEFSELTPFEPEQVIAAGQSLLAFGIDAEDLTSTLKNLGDISAGTGTDFNELAQIFGKAKVQGRLFAEDINQLTGRGIPIIGEFAKQFGVADSEVKKLVETGKIGFPELEKAFSDLTSEGGKFFDLTAKQSEILGGKISTLKGVFNGFLRDLGERLVPTLKVVTQGLIDFFSNIRPESIIRLGKAIGLAVASLVSYKTAVALASLSTRTFLKGLVRARVAMRAFNTAVKANPLGLLVTVLTAAASAFVLFKDDADDATTAQNEFNESVLEGQNILENTQGIEDRAKRVSSLNKRQLEQLAEDIETEIKLNEDKAIKLDATNEKIINDQSRFRTSQEEIEKAFGEGAKLLTEETAEAQLKGQEGITKKELEESLKRLENSRKAVEQQLKIVREGGDKLTAAQIKALRKQEAKAAEEARKRASLDEAFFVESFVNLKDSLDSEQKLRDEALDRIAKGEIDAALELIKLRNKANDIPTPDFVALPEEVIDDEVEAVIRAEVAKQEAIEETRKKQREAAAKILDSTEQLAEATIGSAKDVLKTQLDLLDERVDAQRNALEDALFLNRTASNEQVEIEEKRLEELQAQRSRAAAQFEAIAQVETVATQALAVAKGILAVTEAFAEGQIVGGIATSVALAATIATAIVSLNNAFTDLPAFAEGTERVTGPGTATSDSIAARLSAGERVVPTRINDKFFDTLNEFQNDTPMAALLHSIAKGDMAAPVVSRERQTAGAINDNSMLNEMKKMNKRLDKLDINVSMDKEGFAASITKYSEKKNRFKKKAGV